MSSSSQRYTANVSDAVMPLDGVPLIVASWRDVPSLNTLSLVRLARARFATLAS